MLRRALYEKAQFAADTGLMMYIVTQFGFNAQAVIDWETALSTMGSSYLSTLAWLDRHL